MENGSETAHQRAPRNGAKLQNEEGVEAFPGYTLHRGDGQYKVGPLPLGNSVQFDSTFTEDWLSPQHRDT